MKKAIPIITGIIILLAIGIATSLPTILTNANWTVPITPATTRYSGNITFLADGKPKICYLDEPNMKIDDDFEDCLERSFQGMKITNATDWIGRPYKQITINNITYRSFNETKLNLLEVSP